MAIKFNNCEISINNDRILAQDVSISKNNDLSPVFGIGNRNPLKNTHVGPIKNNIKINYLLETNIEPNYYLVQKLKGYEQNVQPASITVCGLYGTGYLSSYNIFIDENDVIKASAEYDVYHEIQGEIEEQLPQSYTGYNTLSSLGLAHYWTTFIQDIDGNNNGEIINLNYSYKTNWKPIYKIGDSLPCQVTLLNSQENFDITCENSPQVTFSGQNINDIIQSYYKIQINNISEIWTDANRFILYLYLASGQLVSCETNMSDNSVPISKLNIVKYY